MPCAMVMKKPGRKNASGIDAALTTARAPAPITVASASSEPTSTMVSVETRLPMRVEMKLPVKKPIGNSMK